jgi:hypothetical protein
VKKETYNMASTKSSLCSRSMYLLNTMPAGHSCPPHPDLRSSCSLRGGERREEKSREVVEGALYSGSGVRSSPIARGENSGEGERVIVRF